MSIYLILVFVFLASSANATEQISVEFIQQDPDGCACSLRLDDYSKFKETPKSIFWQGLGDHTAIMKIDGKVQSLQKHQDETKGTNLGKMEFTNSDYAVAVNFRKAPDTCPKEKGVDGCEFTDVYGDIVVKRIFDKREVNLLGIGSCGC